MVISETVCMIIVFTIALLTTGFGQVWAEYVCDDVTPQVWRKSEGKVHSLSSGKVAATPILKSVPSQFSPFVL